MRSRIKEEGSLEAPFRDGKPCGGGLVAVLHVRTGGRCGHPVKSSQGSVKMV